jgi:hypothetical protein
MIYIIDDLSYIFIRIKNLETGHWENQSLADIATKEFQEFMYKKFQVSIIKEADGSILQIPGTEKHEAYKTDTSELDLQDRLDIVNHLSAQGVIFYMISREARDNY